MGVRAQLQAFALRGQWRRGEFHDFNPKEIELTTTALTQFEYLKLYLSELPYHQVSRTSVLQPLMNKPGQLFNQNFRFQTLLSDRGMAAGVLRLGDWLERLYLWTWRWLDQPEKFPVALVTSTLNLISKDTLKTIHRAPADDQMLLHLSLGWLSLLDASAELDTKSIFKSTFNALPGEESNTWRLEKVTQHYVRSLLQHKYDQAETFREELAKSVSPLAKYFLQFAKRFDSRLSQFKNTETPLVINLSSYEITRQGQLTFQSATLCRALAALHEKEYLRLEDLCYSTFFLREYDAFLHGAKLSNLLARINKLLPADTRVLQRDGRAFMTGDKSQVQIQQACAHTKELAMDRDWPAFANQWNTIFQIKTENFSLQQIFAQLQIQGEFNRSELQQRYNISKTQAQRIITQWLASTKIVKAGQGKSIKYLFNQRRAV